MRGKGLKIRYISEAVETKKGYRNFFPMIGGRRSVERSLGKVVGTSIAEVLIGEATKGTHFQNSESV